MAAPTTAPLVWANNTGRQSATMMVQTTPASVATQASASVLSGGEGGQQPRPCHAPGKNTGGRRVGLTQGPPAGEARLVCTPAGRHHMRAQVHAGIGPLADAASARGAGACARRGRPVRHQPICRQRGVRRRSRRVVRFTPRAGPGRMRAGPCGHQYSHGSSRPSGFTPSACR